MALSPQQAETICERLAGGESLRAIVRSGGFPPLSTTYAALERDHSEQYARARLLQAESYADEVQEVAHQEPGTYITMDEFGNTIQRVDNGEVAHRKLLIDTLKWTAAHLRPKTWGDKVTQEHTGADGAPIIIKIDTGVPVKPSDA